MGTGSSYKRKYLNKIQIENICQTNQFFYSSKKFKIGDSSISLIEFYHITNGLIGIPIIKKIMEICQTKSDKFTVNDLKYFYALLNTNNIDAKINFLLLFSSKLSVKLTIVYKLLLDPLKKYEIY